MRTPSTSAAVPTVTLAVAFSTELGLADADIDAVYLRDRATAVVIQQSTLFSAAPIRITHQHPSAARYGESPFSCRQWAGEFIGKLGFPPSPVNTLLTDLGDDSGDVIHLEISVAVGTFALGSLDDLKEWVGQHYGKHFDSLNEEQRQEFVGRFIEAHADS